MCVINSVGKDLVLFLLNNDIDYISDFYSIFIFYQGVCVCVCVCVCIKDNLAKQDWRNLPHLLGDKRNS